MCAIWGILALAAGLIVSISAPRPAAALQPANAIPTELRYVPHDAAFFIYADAEKIWKHDLLSQFRKAEKKTFDTVELTIEKSLGAKPDALKSLVVFMPTIKQPDDTRKAGFVLTFAKPFDKKKLEAGVTELFGKNEKVTVHSANETTAVVLLGLDDKYSKPRPANDEGPITKAIQAAATGKHTFVAAVNMANMPDEIRKDDLPGGVRAFQPIFHSESLIATLDLGKSLDLNVRVKTKRAAQAIDAEKALAALAKLLGDELGGEIKPLEMEATKDAALKDLVAVVKAIVDTAKKAKFQIDGNDALMSMSLPLAELPLVNAFSTAVRKIETAASAQVSTNNLKQIALAMHNYHDAIGAFPPAAVCDKKGKPQLSWRVLILPYLDQETLYKQFKLDEPWDSENNKKLIDKMPRVYSLTGKPGGTDTHYRVFVGNGAGFDWVMGSKINNITDGTSNTFMCVTAATAVPWTKPDELEFDPEKDMSKLLGLVVNGKAQVAMFDGSVRSLNKLPSKETLNALITRAGGEVIGNDF
jgi:hypothetical protein